MFQIKKILFPIDFSERSRTAAPYAEEFAAHFNAELVLLHVIQPPDYNTALTDAHRQHSEGFDKFLGSELQNLRVKRIVTHANEPADKIIEYAAQHDVDLIVIPTQGMGIYRRLIIGSTSAKVLHDADCAVWTSVHWEQVPPLEKIHYRHICCAVDLHAHSVKVLEWADQFAKSYGADVTLVHAGKKQGSAKAIEKLQMAAGSNAAVRVENGEPAATAAKIAQELDADLLVIGRGAESGIFGRLVANAYAVIRQSPCPVVSV
jgi:nucleotide-binding universal stress UspA family protein